MEHTKELIEHLGEGEVELIGVDELMDELQELIRLREKYDTLVEEYEQLEKENEKLKEFFRTHEWDKNAEVPFIEE